jgi:hypothetical protein
MPRSTISGTAIDLDGKEMILDADQDTTITADTDDTIDFKIAGVEHISLSNSSGSTVVKPRVDAKDVIFQQYDGNEVARISDGRKLKLYDDGGESITSDGSNLKLESGGTTFTVPASDGSNGQYMQTNGSGVLSFSTVNTTTNLDDIATGDAASTLATSAGNITIDAQGNDTDIIFKGTDGNADTTFLTLDGSDAGAASFNGVVTANAGVVVDNITIDGTEIDLSSGDLTLDVAGDIVLDADGADIKFSDGGTHFGTVTNSSSDLVITSAVQDKDILFKGDDGGSGITALTLDMSDAGKATFNSGAVFGGAVLPSSDDAIDLGSSSKQWRDIYTGDINLNNTKTRDNEVDGTRGSWTIQEGENDLFILNRLNGKKYRFKLEEME